MSSSTGTGSVGSGTTTRPLRLLCLSPYPSDGPSVRHRVLALAGPWARRGVRLELWPFMTRSFYRRRRRFGAAATVEKALHTLFCTARLLLRLPLVVRYDVVLIHREAFPIGPAWVERLVARLARRTVYDVDDAIWAPPANAVDQRRWLASKHRYRAILRACDAVVVGNETLARYTREHNDQVVIIPTAYADPLAAGLPPRDPAAIPVLVWIGNLGNAHYVRQVLPALEEVARSRAFRLRLIGGADIGDVRSPTVDIEHVPWTEAREHELLATADVGLMPLSATDYDEGKCAFKIIQYYSAGLPVVASPVGMNQDIVEPGVTGFLPDSREAWVRAVDGLLADPQKRATMGAAGRARFEQGYTYEHTAALWLPVLTGEAAPGAS